MLSLDGRAGLGRGGLAHVEWRLVALEQSGCQTADNLQQIFLYHIKLLESPIPTPPATATASSQKAHFDNISGTKRGSIDPLVSK